MPASPPSLKARALRLLALREHTRAELSAKLARHVQEGDDVGALLDALQAQGYLDDARAAASMVHRRAPRLGTQRVLAELRRKGVGEELVRARARELADTELERARAVWHKRYGTAPATPSREEQARQMRFLASRGFAPDVIRRVVRADDENQ